MMIYRRIRWVKPVAHLGEKKCSQNLYREPEGKIPLRRSKLRWLDNIRMGVREIDWILLAQDRD
jgi:hypothetical protein